MSPPADGFCDNHRPNVNRQYAACWVCSRQDETKKVAAAEQLFVKMPTLPSMPLGLIGPWRDWLAAVHDWRNTAGR
jgi:hypothetical protein